MPKTPDFFHGKTVVITGGASGIGRATALIFAREGANVVVSDVNAEGAERVANQWVEGEWTEVVLEDETCSITSEDQPVVCPFALANGGRWRVTATVVDDAGRPVRGTAPRTARSSGVARLRSRPGQQHPHGNNDAAR